MNKIHKFKITKVPLGLFMIMILVGALPSRINAESLKDKVNTNLFGVAIKGYDTVSYFTEGRAVKGKRKFSHNCPVSVRSFG